MQTKRQQRVLLISQNSGTGSWRVIWPLRFLNNHKICEVCWVKPEWIPARDRNWLEYWDTIVLHQIWMDDFIPLVNFWKTQGKRIVVSTDDLIVGHQIPDFIKGGLPYRDQTIMRNVHDIMTLADKVLVTQPFLAKGLAKFYEVPESRFVVFPNLPPSDWLGGLFNPAERAKSFSTRKVLRIGVLSSLTHYSLEKDAKSEDDLGILLEAMSRLKERGLKDKTIWVLFTNENESIRSRIGDLANVEFRPMSQICDYPRAVANADLHICATPLQNSDFNNAKSNIKVVECAAFGIPIIASHAYPYDNCLPQLNLFTGGIELGDRIEAMMGWSESRYFNEVKDAYQRTFNQSLDYFGQKLNGYWLEGNLNIVGDAFLSFNPPADKDGIVAPEIRKEEKEDVQKKND